MSDRIPVFWLERAERTINGERVQSSEIYVNPATGERFRLQDAPPGAMWDQDFRSRDVIGDPWTGPDGISLVVRLPNGSDWCVDGEASNCTRTQWKPKVLDGRLCNKVWHGRTHFCWVRHGDPRDPQGLVTGVKLHVDKNGDTCSAGAGSVQSGDWHGYLDHGELATSRRA